MCNIIPSRDKLMYHMSHIDNVISIVRNGLMPRNVLNENNISFIDVADGEIIYKRRFCSSDLANYILFHFDLDNAFDYNVCRRKGCDNVVIFAIVRPDYWNEEAKSHAYIYNKLVSKSTVTTLKKLNPIIVNVCSVLDSYETGDFEGILKLCSILVETDVVEFEDMDRLLQTIQLERDILDKLCEANIIDVTLIGYCLNK